MASFFIALVAFAFGQLIIAFLLVGLSYFLLKYWKPQDPGSGAGPGQF